MHAAGKTGEVMTRQHLKVRSAYFLLIALMGGSRPSLAQQPQNRVVRIAEIEIDPAALDAYEAALKEEIEASIRSEPGVLTLYATSLKGQPTQIRIFETYADMAAYQAHLETPHFKKYKVATRGMVKDLRLFEADPIILGAKSHQ